MEDSPQKVSSTVNENEENNSQQDSEIRHPPTERHIPDDQIVNENEASQLPTYKENYVLKWISSVHSTDKNSVSNELQVNEDPTSGVEESIVLSSNNELETTEVNNGLAVAANFNVNERNNSSKNDNNKTSEKNEAGETDDMMYFDNFAFPYVNKSLYTSHEDKTLVEVIDKNRLINQVQGNIIWKSLEDKQILPGRSWQSMRNRFVKTIIPKKLYNKYLNPKVADSWLNYLQNKNQDHNKDTSNETKSLHEFPCNSQKKTSVKQLQKIYNVNVKKTTPEKENSKKTFPTNNSQLKRKLSQKNTDQSLSPQRKIPTSFSVDLNRSKNNKLRSPNKQKSTTSLKNFASPSFSSRKTEPFPKENITTAGTSSSSKNTKKRIISNNLKRIENMCKEKVSTNKKDYLHINANSEFKFLLELITQNYVKHIELGEKFKMKNRYRYFVKSISPYLNYARQLMKCDEESERGSDTEEESNEDDASDSSIRFDKYVNKQNFSEKGTQTQNEENDNIGEEKRTNSEQVACLKKKRKLFTQSETN